MISSMLWKPYFLEDFEEEVKNKMREKMTYRIIKMANLLELKR